MLKCSVTQNPGHKKKTLPQFLFIVTQIKQVVILFKGPKNAFERDKILPSIFSLPPSLKSYPGILHVFVLKYQITDETVFSCTFFILVFKVGIRYIPGKKLRPGVVLGTAFRKDRIKILNYLYLDEIGVALNMISWMNKFREKKEKAYVTYD